jgi:hypothetical protein
MVLLQKIAALEAEQKHRPDPMDWRLRGPARQAAGGRHWSWLNEQDHGPRIARLHGDGYDGTLRRRVSRALAALAATGLVELWGWRSNVTHVRLTEAGRAAVAAGASS